MRAGRHYTAYRPSESRADDRVFRRPLSHAAKTAVAKQFYYVYDNEHRAGVAQSVEQRIRNAKVGGSIPFSGTISTDKRPSEKWFSDGLCAACRIQVSDLRLLSIKRIKAVEEVLNRWTRRALDDEMPGDLF